MKILRILIVFLLSVMFSAQLHAIFIVDIYGNIEGVYRDKDTSSEISESADWKIDEAKYYNELKLSGVNLEGFNLWVKIGSWGNFSTGNMPGIKGYTTTLLGSSGVLDDLSFLHNDDNMFHLEVLEAHLEKEFKLHKGTTKLKAWRGEEKNAYIGQSSDLNIFDSDLAEKNTRSGIRWDSDGLFGFSSQGFIMDYRSDYRDENDESASDKFAYVFGTRWNRQLLELTAFTWSMSFDFAASQYYKFLSVDSVSNPNEGSVTNEVGYFYNLAGFETTMNGAIPKVFNYYLSGGFIRSYAPESFPYEHRNAISILGNTNALAYLIDSTIDREFKIGKVNLGQVFLSYYLFTKQPRFDPYFGNITDKKAYKETFKIRYNLPYKAISIYSYFNYEHDYINVAKENRHIWSVGEFIESESSSKLLQKHVDLTIKFKSDFEFRVAWDQELGAGYLGGFESNAINFLTITASGETTLGSISPQFKIIAPGDTNRQQLSAGIDIYLKLSDRLKFTSRFAYVASKNTLKTGDGSPNWWTAYIQFLYELENGKITLELGNGDQTDNGLVSDSNLLNGAVFERKVYFKMEYWS